MERYAIWDARTAERLHSINHKQTTGSPLGGLHRICSRLEGLLPPDISGGLVSFTDARTGETKSLARCIDGVEALTFFGDGAWLASTDRGGSIQLYELPKNPRNWETFSSEPAFRWAAHHGRGLSLAATPDGNRLISGGRDDVVRVWSPDLSPLRWKLEHGSHDRHFYDLATGPDHRLYTAGDTISIWDLNERRLLCSFGRAETPWKCVACSADGRFLAGARLGHLSSGT